MCSLKQGKQELQRCLTVTDLKTAAPLSVELSTIRRQDNPRGSSHPEPPIRNSKRRPKQYRKLTTFSTTFNHCVRV